MRYSLPLIAATVIVAACSSTEAAPVANIATAAQDGHASHSAASNGELTAAQKQGVADVRKVTQQFHNFQLAKDAGYNVQYPAGCAESPDGAQAFHWLNESLVDGKVELLKPELLMFEPQPNGSMQLIGVDYVVPLTASATPPTLLGVPFARNEPLGVWALHIWAWRPNPSGMFAAWNPKVSCKFAKQG